MSALPEVVPFSLPKKPRVKEEDAPPDQRKLAVIPIRACTDKLLTHGMIKALILICSYCNRSGITWVSQKLLAEKMGVSQQAISKHLVKLTKAGYLEILKRPIPGQKHTTWRVIYDPSIKAEDAVAITSSIEDTRPPYMKREQAMQAEQPDRAGQAKIASLITKVLRQPTKEQPVTIKKEDSMTVKKMKEDITKAKTKRTPKASVPQPLKVVHQAQPIASLQESVAQPFEGVSTTSRGCGEHKNKGYKEDVYKESYVLNNQQRIELKEAGLTEKQVIDNLQVLSDAYASEGLKLNPDRLVAELIELAAVSRGIA